MGAFAEALESMSGDVVSLHGAQPIAPPPNQTLVKELERLLEAARSGEIIGMAGSYWHRNSTATYSYAGMVGSFAMLGGLECLKEKLVRLAVRGD
jgi:hypothetical protein